MKMQNKIKATYENIHFVETSSSEIHVVDYTDKTNSVRDIEFLDCKPSDIESLKLVNSDHLSISAAVFENRCIIDTKTNKELSHCECAVFPSENDDTTWVLFIEIKDCKPKNIGQYFSKTKEQVIKTVAEFREKGLIARDKNVHALISFPNRNKVDYYNQLIQQGERQWFLHQHKIIIKGTNILTIKNNRVLI
jgi:hypothetical protein